MGLYIEIPIRTDLDRIWARTQDPAEHQRWDLRFTRIDYAPRGLGEPQRFTYAVTVAPGFTITGTGVTAGERHRPDGTRTSALRFASTHPLSLIADGRGYWRYVPVADGVRFVTGYDYTPRWGRFGRVMDRVAFRPLMGWGTAWSFDRLRLWCERDITPERSLRHGLAEAALRLLAVALAAGVNPLLAVPVAVAAALAPALPSTPSSRRCLRRPLAPTTSPALLLRLEAS